MLSAFQELNFVGRPLTRPRCARRICTNAPLPALIDALCTAVVIDLALPLPDLRHALEACSPAPARTDAPYAEASEWVECYFTGMSRSLTHEFELGPCPGPRPSPLLHAYIVSLLSPTVTMFQHLFVANMGVFRSLYVNGLPVDATGELFK